MSILEPQGRRHEAQPLPPVADGPGILLPGVEPEPAGRRPRGMAALRFLALLLATALAGGLVAGLLVPWVAAPAIAGQAGYGLLAPRDDALLDARPVRNTRILARDGSLLTEVYRRNRTPVSSEAIAPVMKQALVAIEDARFYEHDGVDLRGLARALSRNLLAGDVVEGGSTLTQQLVKQIRLQNATDPEGRQQAVAEDVGRKLREAQLAMGMEQRHTKDEILTRYLNLVYFGAGAYGVEAAARTFFGVPAAELDLPQAATLAGLVQSPAAYDPFTSPERATSRRDVVLSRMLDLGMISADVAREARATPLDVSAGTRTPNGCLDARIGHFFCDYVLSWLEDEVGLTQDELETGGYTIRTTLRPGAQRAADAAVRRALPLDDPRAVIYTSVQPGTGRVFAMAVNRRYGLDQDDPTQTTVNLHLAAGQGTGSTYKVFTAAAALARGYGLDHRIRTGDPYRSRVYEDGGEPYEVRNAGRYPEELTLEQALYMSSNTYFLALEDQLGSVEGPVRMAQRLGLTSLDPVADQVVAQNRGSFTFGAEATSPLALTNAYATLAERGVRCTPRPVEEILGPDGEPATGPDGVLLMPPDRCERAVPAGLADALNRALVKDVAPGFPGQTGSRAHIPGVQIAGKTGTSQDRYSATFVGYTPGLAASVMVYDPSRNRDVGSFGGGIPATVWRDATAPVLGWMPSERFVPPPAVYVEGTRERDRRTAARSARPVAAPAPPAPAPELRTAAVARPEPASESPATPDRTAPRTSEPAPVPAVPPRTGSAPPTPTPPPPPAPIRTPVAPSPVPVPVPVPVPAPSPAPSPEPAPASAPEPAPVPAPSPEPAPAPRSPSPSPAAPSPSSVSPSSGAASSGAASSGAASSGAADPASGRNSAQPRGGREG